jgi:hypothetical protein
MDSSPIWGGRSDAGSACRIHFVFYGPVFMGHILLLKTSCPTLIDGINEQTRVYKEAYSSLNFSGSLELRIEAMSSSLTSLPYDLGLGPLYH